METTGFDGQTTIRSAGAERLQHARCRAGRRGSLEAHTAHRDLVAQADEVVLEGDLRSRRPEAGRLARIRRVRSGSSVTGSSRTATPRRARE